MFLFVEMEYMKAWSLSCVCFFLVIRRQKMDRRTTDEMGRMNKDQWAIHLFSLFTFCAHLKSHHLWKHFDSSILLTDACLVYFYAGLLSPIVTIGDCNSFIHSCTAVGGNIESLWVGQVVHTDAGGLWALISAWDFSPFSLSAPSIVSGWSPTQRGCWDKLASNWAGWRRRIGCSIFPILNHFHRHTVDCGSQKILLT